MSLIFIHSEKTTKFCEIFLLLLTAVHTVKSRGKISQNFVAFSEYVNFSFVAHPVAGYGTNSSSFTPNWIHFLSHDASLGTDQIWWTLLSAEQFTSIVGSIVHHSFFLESSSYLTMAIFIENVKRSFNSFICCRTWTLHETYIKFAICWFKFPFCEKGTPQSLHLKGVLPS